MDNAAFMDEFFSQVCVAIVAQLFVFVFGTCLLFPLACLRGVLRVRVHFQIEDIRNSIEKIDVNVAEVKKLYSVILSAPTSDQGKNCQHHELFIGFSFSFSALTFDLCTRCVLCVPANKAALR